jgi:hypothetical protein
MSKTESKIKNKAVVKCYWEVFTGVSEILREMRPWALMSFVSQLDPASGSKENVK